MMRTWELQSGFPVLTVTRDGDLLRFTQERFMYDKNLNSTNLWWIPLNYVTAADADFSRTTPNYWMPNVRNMIALIEVPLNFWVLFNIKRTSYYDIFSGYKVIHYRNRAQLIDDAYNLAKGDRIDYDILFNLMNYLWQEIDYIPWVPASRAGNYLNRRLVAHESIRSIKSLSEKL